MTNNRLARESFWGTIVTYIGVGLGFFTTFFVLTYYLTPEEVGLIRLLLEVGTLLSSLCLVGLSTSISRYFPYFRDDNPHSEAVHHGFWRYVCLIAIGGCAVFLPLFIVLREPILALFARNSALFVEYYYLVLPITLIIVFWTIVELYTVQLLRLVAPRFVRELLLRVLLLVVYLTYALTQLSQAMFLWAVVGVYGVCLVASLVYLRRITSLSWCTAPGFVTKELRSSFVRYTTLTTIATVGTVLAGRMDLFMIAAIDRDGLASAAVFSVAFFMVTIMDIPTRAIISISTPLLSDAMTQGDVARAKGLYARIAFYQFASACIIFLALWVAMDSIFVIMPGGADYVGAKPIFFFLGLAKLIEVLFTGCHPIVHASRHYHWNIYYTLVLIFVALCANLYLVPQYGATGAAGATLLTCALGYGLLQGLLYRATKIHPLAPRLLFVPALTVGVWAMASLLPYLGNAYVDLMVRSSLVVLLGGGGLWLSGLAPEAVAFARGYISKIVGYAHTPRCDK